MLSPTAKVVIREVLERINEWPETHDQSEWFLDYRGGQYSLWDVIRQNEWETPLRASEMASCNTTACIVGHAILAADELGFGWNGVTPHFIGLDLFNIHEEAAERLFYGMSEFEASKALQTALDEDSWDWLI